MGGTSGQSLIWPARRDAQKHVFCFVPELHRSRADTHGGTFGKFRCSRISQSVVAPFSPGLGRDQGKVGCQYRLKRRVAVNLGLVNSLQCWVGILDVIMSDETCLNMPCCFHDIWLWGPLWFGGFVACINRALRVSPGGGLVDRTPRAPLSFVNSRLCAIG